MDGKSAYSNNRAMVRGYWVRSPESNKTGLCDLGRTGRSDRYTGSRWVFEDSRVSEYTSLIAIARSGDGLSV